MRPFQALSLLAILLASSSSSGASVLEDACKSIAATNKGIGYDYCIKFFQASKKSSTADIRGLALIAVKITGATAASTVKRIHALKASDKDKKTREGLSDCADVYSQAVDELRAAAKGIASGVPRGLRDAATNLSAAMGAPGTCEEGFGELGVKSPLTAENSEFFKEATLALSVTSELSS
ncbi:putative invertase inhibitor [Brachypodium distachyon]|uniref:Pectinesterase inhibitor domain-containing protein n=1 Tax=Brachypodium distachyon TaxID=15368 RepID=I1J130_BRADI|nr:putative invertase inhibitor [Brachypodium distachyon]KQJ84265.1 hypothetical protein BRADI_5g19700v3 [Brachypodium distachyon]|eukprot:XP_010227235.1 putative invertase inhibitor [Brachypodium distachyon]